MLDELGDLEQQSDQFVLSARVELFQQVEYGFAVQRQRRGEQVDEFFRERIRGLKLMQDGPDRVLYEVAQFEMDRLETFLGIRRVVGTVGEFDRAGNFAKDAERS